MKKRMYRLLVCASITALVFWFAACSGGGSSNEGSSGLTYSGETSPATITEDNAGTLATSALDAGSNGSAFNLTGLATLSGVDSGTDASDQPMLLGFVRVLEDAVGDVDFAAVSEQNVSAAAQSENGSLAGSCGGNASYSISGNSNTGEFSGKFSFNGFCADGLTMNGSASFSGIVDMATDTLESFIFTFGAMTATSGSESVTLKGRIAFTVSDSTITMNLTIKNNTNGWMCKVENYVMVVDDQSSYTAISVSGRYYDQDYGYVELITNEPLRYYPAGEYPYYGKLTLYGAIGVGNGETSAVITAIDATHCQVEVDSVGIGTCSIVYDSILWSDL